MITYARYSNNAHNKTVIITAQCHLSVINQSIHPTIHRSIDLSVRPSVSPSIYPCVRLRVIKDSLSQDQAMRHFVKPHICDIREYNTSTNPEPIIYLPGWSWLSTLTPDPTPADPCAGSFNHWLLNTSPLRLYLLSFPSSMVPCSMGCFGVFVSAIDALSMSNASNLRHAPLCLD